MEAKKRRPANVRSTGRGGTAAANVFSEWSTFDVSVVLGKEFAALPQYGEAIGEDRSCLFEDEDIEKEMHRARTRNLCSSIAEPV